MAEVELTAGRAYRVRLAGSKRTDPVIIETVEDGKVSFRLTWKSKGKRVVSPKRHERPVGEVEVIEAINLSEQAQKAEQPAMGGSPAPVAEEPKGAEPKRPRGGRRKETAGV